jgi:hypothetical protein
MFFKSKLLLSGIMFIAGWSISDLTRQYPGYTSNLNYSITDSTEFLQQFTYRKEIPKEIEHPVLEALSHYPELRDVRIKFIIKEQYATLTTRPTMESMLMPEGHREYVITISKKTIPKLTPLLFQNLPAGAQVGIIGHELAHVVDFSSNSLAQDVKKVVGHLSAAYMDNMEFNTDRICIEHGLGAYLEQWSSYIRSTMHTVYWRGADYVNKGDEHYERYMNPSTIEKYIMHDQKY